MTHTVFRQAISTAAAVACFAGAVVAGAGTSSAQTGTNFTLYCYANPTGANPSRIEYSGTRQTITGSVSAVSGTGVFQQWTGRSYVSTSQPPLRFDLVGVRGGSSNDTCRALSLTLGNGFNVGSFA